MDIQARAIEICKLRLWLSLVVDYPLDVDVDTCEKQSFRDSLKRLPALPNLDFKIRRANSLIDTIHGEPVPLGKLHASDQARVVLNKLTTAKREFYRADSVPDKRKLRFTIYAAMAELAQIELTVARNELGLLPDPENAGKVAELDQGQKAMAKILGQIRDARKMKAADQDDALERIREFFDDEQKPTFVWQLDFAEVFHREKNPGFDLITGNPPFVRIQVLNQVAPDQVAFFKEHYYSASKGNYDLYLIFVEHGLQLLQPRGQLAFILPHKFFNAQYGEPLRELIAEGKHLRHVVHFGDQQIFPGATNYVCLLFLARVGADACRWLRADDLPAWLGTFRGQETALSAVRFTPAEWNFAVGKSTGLFEKLQGMPVKLGDIADMFVGLQTSADTVFLFKDYTNGRSPLAKVWSKELEEEVEIERALLKPVIRSGKIGRYWATPTAAVLFPYTLTGQAAQLLARMELRKEFPHAWKYLSRNQRLLEAREHGKFEEEWWQLYPKNLGLWQDSKIMIPYMITELAAFLDSGGNYFVNVTTGGFGVRLRTTQLNSRYVTGLLNSRLLDWFLKRVSTTFHGGYFAANKQFLVQLPIRPLDLGSASDRPEHDALVALVDRILAAKRTDGAADMAWLERESDERFYRLYGMTEEEIQIVEEAGK